MLIRQFIALLSFCTLELTGCNKIAAPSSMYHHQSSMNFNSLRSSVIVRNPNYLIQKNRDKKTKLPYKKTRFPLPYEFRPVSPTLKGVPPSSFDINKLIKPLTFLPISRPLNQPELIAVTALLQLDQSQSG